MIDDFVRFEMVGWNLEQDIEDVSVVICTKNNKDNIRACIESVVKQNPGEIIVVDGTSNDGTQEIIQSLPVRHLTDPGKGLALARQIGLDAVNGKYVFYVGDDNVIPQGGIWKLKCYLQSHGWICAGMLTRLQNAEKDYWSYCSDLRYQVKIREGICTIVGTPCMYRVDVLKSFGWNIESKFSDDTELHERIANSGYKVGYSDLVCYEIGKEGFHEIYKRYKNIYGVSDAEVWRRHRAIWSVKRKLRSLLHPFLGEFVTPMKKIATWSDKVYVAPYFVWIMLVRYYGWMSHSFGK